MVAPVFIGDEVTAAGFRLAGVRIRTPQEEELSRILTWANDNTSLIFITAEYAAKLSQEQQTGLLSQQDPPVVVIPDIRSNTPVQDLATQLRAQLGVLE
ncbi:MAG: V-type ATP synthase subunit F [Gammaproteobacteria bacterium]|jgi:vacuolar-type H+-ATPase subunit F/Vma7